MYIYIYAICLLIYSSNTIHIHILHRRLPCTQSTVLNGDVSSRAGVRYNHLDPPKWGATLEEHRSPAASRYLITKELSFGGHTFSYIYIHYMHTYTGTCVIIHAYHDMAFGHSEESGPSASALELYT